MISKDPLVILDGAHNPPGALAAAQTLKSSFTLDGPKALIVGMTEEKDADWMLSNLNAGQFDCIFVTEASSPRSMPAEVLASVATKYCSKTIVCPNPEEALKEAIQISSTNGVIFGTGSMYVVGALREANQKFQSERK